MIVLAACATCLVLGIATGWACCQESTLMAARRQEAARPEYFHLWQAASRRLGGAHKLADRWADLAERESLDDVESLVLRGCSHELRDELTQSRGRA